MSAADAKTADTEGEIATGTGSDGLKQNTVRAELSCFLFNLGDGVVDLPARGKRPGGSARRIDNRDSLEMTRRRVIKANCVGTNRRPSLSNHNGARGTATAEQEHGRQNRKSGKERFHNANLNPQPRPDKRTGWVLVWERTRLACLVRRLAERFFSCRQWSQSS